MSRIKLLFDYITLFMFAVLFSGVMNLFIMNVTVLNDDYVINRISKMNYYKSLSKDIKEEMSNYVIQAGFEDDILDNIYNEDDIKLVVNDIIHKYYSNENISVDTSKLQNNIKNNIDKFIKESKTDNYVKEDVDRFINKIISIYTNHLNVSNIISKSQLYLYRTNKIVKCMLIVLSVLLFMIIIIRLFIYRNLSFASVLFTNAIISLVGCRVIVKNIDIDNINLYSKSISLFIKDIMNNLIHIIRIEAIVCIIFGFIFAIIKAFMENKKRSSN